MLIFLVVYKIYLRAGLLICCYLIEEKITVFNKLADPEADPTKDMYRKALRDRHSSGCGFGPWMWEANNNSREDHVEPSISAIMPKKKQVSKL